MSDNPSKRADLCRGSHDTVSETILGVWGWVVDTTCHATNKYDCTKMEFLANTPSLSVYEDTVLLMIGRNIRCLHNKRKDVERDARIRMFDDQQHSKMC